MTGNSFRYKKRLQGSPDRNRSGQKMTCGRWFWKVTGCIVVCATLVSLVGSFWFAWKIRTGLGRLADEQQKEQELLKDVRLLQGKEKVLFDKKRIETVAAAELSLYPPKEHYIGGGITVRIPRP